VHRDGKDAGCQCADGGGGAAWHSMEEGAGERESVCSWAGAGRRAVRILGRGILGRRLSGISADFFD
jgi:hypothetical protein